MGDIIYPAIVLKRVNTNVRYYDVINYLKLTIGDDPSMYLFGEPMCKIYHKDGAKTRVLIPGILLELDVIRTRFGKERLKNQDVYLDTVDFGVPRNPNDGDMTHFMLQLHNDLKGGQGFLPCINLFTDEFNQQTGGTANLQCDVLFSDCLANINNLLLTHPGILIVETGSKGRGNISERELKPTKSVPYPYHQIMYKSKMEALQSICFLGGNPNFTPNDRQFVINDRQELSCRERFHGLKADGTILDIDDLMNEHGYVPLEQMKQDILDQQKIKALQKPCELCGNAYTILGISSSMAWVAAVCGCKPQGSIYQWGKETFFRICLNGPSRHFFESKFEQIELNKVDTPYKLIRGVLPAFKDIQEFMETVWCAYLSNLLCEKRVLHNQQTLGLVSNAREMEQRWVGQHWRKIIKIIVQVKKTPLWSNEGRQRMHRVKLIPVGVGKARMPNAFVPFWADRDKGWLKGTVYKIDDHNEHGNVSNVTILAEVPVAKSICSQDALVVIPKPPVLERNGIRRVLEIWSESEKTKGDNKMILGKVKTSWELKQMGWCDAEFGSRKEETRQVYMVQIETDWTQTWINLKERMLDSHLGMDITFKRNGRNVKFTGRIVAIDSFYDDEPAFIPSSPDERLSVYAVMALPLKFFISNSQVAVVEEEKCIMKLWMVQPTRVYQRHIPLPSSPTAGLFNDNRNSLDNYRDEDGYSTDDSEDGGHEENMRNLPVRGFYEGVSVYTEDWLEPQLPGDLTHVLCNIGIQRPKRDSSILDFFLTPSSERDHSPGVTANIVKKKGLEQKFKEIQVGLNPSQKQAVKTIMETTVSNIQGPPGSGKSYTLAMAVACLYCKEEGFVVICAPSNYSADVVFGKLQFVKRKYNLKINIVRMLAQSREAIADSDANYLHVQVRQHPKWFGDPIMDEIIENEELNGLAGLSNQERILLRNHKYLISSEILAEVDVVVCTIGCANDQRIENTMSLLEDMDKPLIALFSDESSLVTLPLTLGLLKLRSARFGMLGDELQLPPVVSDPGALTACLNTSWMQLQKATDYFKNNKMFTMLNEQYRMAEPIARVISGFMYEGKLRSAKSVLDRNYASNHHMHHIFPELATTHIGVYTYEGFEEIQFGLSWANDCETGITQALLYRLWYAQVDLSDVAVISMYESHRRMLLQMQRNMPSQFQNVSIATCDSFQGKEKSIVIVNLVKSNPQHNIGFMRHSRRLNVALSRAKDYLLIVGHVCTFGLCKIPDIQKLLSLLSLEDVTVAIMERMGPGFGESYRTDLKDYMLSNGIEQYEFKKKREKYTKK